MDGLTMVFPGPAWREGCSHSLVDLGYSGSGTKMTQLRRDYMNKGEIENAKQAFQLRREQSVTSWAISTIGAEKSNSQGHCIRNMIVNYHHPKVTPDRKGFLVVHLQYRTTELLRKFGADLIFIKEHLIPEVLEGNPWQEHPDAVYMHFASCFFSALFIPVFYQYVDPSTFLKEMTRMGGDTLFYRRCLYRTKTMLSQGEEDYKFASRRNMARFAQNLLAPGGKIDRQKLTRFLEKEGI